MILSAGRRHCRLANSMQDRQYPRLRPKELILQKRDVALVLLLRAASPALQAGSRRANGNRIPHFSSAEAMRLVVTPEPPQRLRTIQGAQAGKYMLPRSTALCTSRKTI
jgi:hypothetical protein